MEANKYFERYEKEMAPARDRFNSKVKPTLEKDPRKLLMFWINFSSLGVEMTEPVESWIRRAGEKTEAIVDKTLGKKLIKHARHEKDHHFMMIKDTQKLVRIWNQHYASPFLEADKLLKRKPKQSTLDYQNLHEDCINSEFPFAQIAIEYEIEHLSVMHGPLAIKNVLSILGDEIKSSLTFIFDHVEIDRAHTEYNKEAISEFINEHPESLDKLIETGTLALKIYGQFLIDCLECRELFEIKTSMTELAFN